MAAVDLELNALTLNNQLIQYTYVVDMNNGQQSSVEIILIKQYDLAPTQDNFQPPADCGAPDGPAPVLLMPSLLSFLF